MSFQSLVQATQTYYPNLKIAYKDQSSLMKFLGGVLFFAPAFMSDYATTVGSTVYYPSEAWITANPRASIDILIHESVHMYRQKKLPVLFQLGYLFPQILFLPALLLCFFHWWFLFIALLFLLPLPAPFRMLFEREAYFAQLYAASTLWQDDVNAVASGYVSFFTGSGYYWMFPFGNSLKADFADAAALVQKGLVPLNDEVLAAQVSSLVKAAQ